MANGSKGEIHPDVKTLQGLHGELVELHKRYYEHLAKISRDTQNKQLTDTEARVDLGFLCREGEALLDDWRKDNKAWKEMFAASVSEEQMRKLFSGEAEDFTVHGRLAYAVCDVEILPDFPRKVDADGNATPEYLQLCDHFGVGEEVRKSPFFKLSYGAVQKHIKDQMSGIAKGIPGLGKSFKKHVAVFTRKRAKTTEDKHD